MEKFGFRKIMVSLLCVLAVSVFPALFLYAQNAAEASLTEIVEPAVIFAGIGLVLFLILTLLMRRRMMQAAVAAAVSMLVMLNFAPIESVLLKIFPEMRYWHCLIVVIFFLLHLIILLGTKLSDEWAGYVVRILSGVFCLLIVMNLGLAVPTIVRKTAAEKEMAIQREQMLAQKVESDEYLPNIYYIILDEYSGFNTIKKIYNYDNESFAQYLESIGFTVSRNSYNDEISTATVTANLMNLDYVATYEGTSVEELNSLRRNGELFRILIEEGYQLKSIGTNTEYYGLDNILLDAMPSGAMTGGGETIEQLLYKKTVMYPCFSTGNPSDRQGAILDALKYISNPENFPEGGQFTLMHIDFPHSPFIFDKDGKTTPTAHWNNWGNPQYYLGQFIYSTKCISGVAASIVENDPTAIIILQSDHSARATSGDISLFMRLIPYEDMKNILNAVYIGGESFEEMQGQSGVNTLRLLVNRLFGYEFELLEVPYGSVEKYKEEAGIKE